MSQHRGDARGYEEIKRYFSSIQKASDILHGRGRHVSLTEAQGGCQDLQGGVPQGQPLGGGGHGCHWALAGHPVPGQEEGAGGPGPGQGCAKENPSQG